MGKQFRVDPDKLQAVADRVQNLLDTVSGNNGYAAGSKPDFDKANVGDLTSAISSLLNYEGGGTDPFSNGYDYEHQGIAKIYQNMITQLTNLQAACANTATAYKDQEHGSKQTVNASDGGGTAPVSPGRI